MNHCQRTIQLGAHFEHTRHGETLQAREHASRRNRSLRQHKGELVARRHIKALGNQLANNNAKLAFSQVVERAGLHMILQN